MGALSHSALRTPHLFVRSAFTLIELLVVVAIISLLMAMLMPTLSRARELVRSVMCASNEKTIGVGFSMYAAAWNDLIPPAGAGSSWLSDTVTDPAWFDNMGRAGYLGPREKVTGTLWGGTMRCYPLTRCPAEGNPLVPYNVNQVSPYQWQSPPALGKTIIFYNNEYIGGSYMMNWSVCRGCYMSGMYTTNVYRPGWSYGSPYYPSSAAMIITDITERYSRVAWYASDIDTCPPETYNAAMSSWSYYTFRHPDKTGNFLFMDGHVGPRKHCYETAENNYQELWHQLPPSRR